MNKCMQGFREGRCRVLVATDVAARGIHVDDLDLIVHCGVPLTSSGACSPRLHACCAHTRYEHVSCAHFSYTRVCCAYFAIHIRLLSTWNVCACLGVSRNVVALHNPESYVTELLRWKVLFWILVPSSYKAEDRGLHVNVLIAPWFWSREYFREVENDGTIWVRLFLGSNMQVRHWIGSFSCRGCAKGETKCRRRDKSWFICSQNRCLCMYTKVLFSASVHES